MLEWGLKKNLEKNKIFGSIVRVWGTHSPPPVSDWRGIPPAIINLSIIMTKLQNTRFIPLKGWAKQNGVESIEILLNKETKKFFAVDDLGETHRVSASWDEKDSSWEAVCMFGKESKNSPEIMIITRRNPDGGAEKIDKFTF